MILVVVLFLQRRSFRCVAGSLVEFIFLLNPVFAARFSSFTMRCGVCIGNRHIELGVLCATQLNSKIDDEDCVE